MMFIGMTGPGGRDARLHGPPRAHGRGHHDARGRGRRGGARQRAHPGRLRRRQRDEPGARLRAAGALGRARAQRGADRAGRAHAAATRSRACAAFVGAPGGWVRGGGSPVQVVLGGTDYAELAQWRDLLMQRMQENPGLSNVQSNYEERKPQLRVAIDRDRAADLGVSLQTVGRTLETVLGSRIVTTFIDRDREYNVILQGRAEDRATPSRPRQPLRALGPHRRADPAVEPRAAHRGSAGPTQLNRFDRLRAITISAGARAGLHARRGARVRRERRRARSCRRGAAQLRRRVARVQAAPAASCTSCSCSRW